MRRLLVVLPLLLLLAACDESEPTDPSTYFQEQVQPLLEDHFGGLTTELGLDLTSYDDLLAGSDNGQVLVPFDTTRSLLVQLATRLTPEEQRALGIEPLDTDELDLLKAWIRDGAPEMEGGPPAYADTEPEDVLVLVAQADALVHVIDTERNVVVRNIDLQELGFSPVANPHHAAVEPDGSAFYVTLIGENTVAKFDTRAVLQGDASGYLSATTSEPYTKPGMVALHPTEDLLYVARSLTAPDAPNSILKVRRSDMTVLEEVAVFVEHPHGLAIGPDGETVFTAALAEERAAAVDVETNEVELTAFPDATPGQRFLHLAVSPDSETLYLTGEQAGQVQFVNASDPTALDLVATLDVAAMPWHPVLSPDGATLYVPNKGAGRLTIIDTEAREVVAEVADSALVNPHGSAVRSDGRYVYVSGDNSSGGYTSPYAFRNADGVGTLTIVDAETNEVVKVIETGELSRGLAAAR